MPYRPPKKYRHKSVWWIMWSAVRRAYQKLKTKEVINGQNVKCPKSHTP